MSRAGSHQVQCIMYERVAVSCPYKFYKVVANGVRRPLRSKLSLTRLRHPIETMYGCA